jgi:hypothetical protein
MTTCSWWLADAAHASVTADSGKTRPGLRGGAAAPGRVGRGDGTIADNHFCQDQKAWSVLYWANHSQIRWADQIDIGQVVKVPVKSAKIRSAPATSPALASSGSVAGQCVHRAGRPRSPTREGAARTPHA